MDGKRILGIIQDIQLWRGDVYRLATLIAEQQREHDAQTAETMGSAEIAEAIRAF